MDWLAAGQPPRAPCPKKQAAGKWLRGFRSRMPHTLAFRRSDTFFLQIAYGWNEAASGLRGPGSAFALSIPRFSPLSPHSSLMRPISDLTPIEASSPLSRRKLGSSRLLRLVSVWMKLEGGRSMAGVITHHRCGVGMKGAPIISSCFLGITGVLIPCFFAFLLFFSLGLEEISR